MPPASDESAITYNLGTGIKYMEEELFRVKDHRDASTSLASEIGEAAINNQHYFVVIVFSSFLATLGWIQIKTHFFSVEIHTHLSIHEAGLHER